MTTTNIIAALDLEIAQLQQARSLLSGHGTGNGRVKAQNGTGVGNGSVAPKRVLSPEARQRIVDAQRKRWAAARKVAK